jgi:hypothetical protein
VSLAADVAIAAAERLERSAGPGRGLALFRRLASNAGAAELRGRAVLGGLRCAIAVRDASALRDLALLWATVDNASEEVRDGVFATCKDLSRAGLGAAAIELAHAEVRRGGTARALYAYARCLDVAGDPRSAAAFSDAIARGEREGAAAIVRASRVRRAAWLARSTDTLAEAVEEAKRVSGLEATLAERLVLARVLLRAPSRFARASALGLLDAVVSAAGAGALARRAIVAAARHADDMQDDLTPLEVDRILALLSRESIARETSRARDAVRAIDRLARAKEHASEREFEAALDEAARVDPALAVLHGRARDILGGRFEAYGALAPSSHPEWSALLDAVVAMRDSAWPRTAHALQRLAESAEAGERLPPHAWTVATATLGSDDAEVRRVAGRLVATMMKTTTAAPPRGWLGLALALAACKMEALAMTARRAAALAKEPGAAEALALGLTRSGWELALAGERSRPIARLREARALAPGAAPSPARGAAAEEPPAPAGRRGPGPSPST